MRVFAELLVLTALCCGPLPDPQPPPKPVPTCEQACANMKVLQCDGWQGSKGVDEQYGTPDDASCVEVCLESVADDPTVVPLWECFATAKSCEECE